MNRGSVVATAVVWAASFALPAHAESIADAVRNHVSSGLEPEKTPPPQPQRRASPPPPRKPTPPPPRRASPPPPNGGRTLTWQPFAEEPPPPPGPSIPERVIGTNLKIDPKIGGGLRGWIPAQYPTVHTSAQTYFTWSVEANATVFKFLNIHRGYYESNGITGPRHQGAVVAAGVVDDVKKAAWVLGMVGVPITKAWEPIIRYESRVFQTTAIPNRPTRIVPHDTSPNADLSSIPATMDRMTLVSGFETLVIGIRYDQSQDHSATIDSKSGRFPPFYLGVGFTQYSKPYQVTVGDSVLDSALFDARFRGVGLAFGATLPTMPDHVIFDLAGQVGLGEVRLLDNLTLNELLPNTPGRGSLRPPEWLIGYVQGDVNVGYLYPILRTKPALLGSIVATGGGATFFYFKTQREQGEKVSAPPLNWDFLWGIRAYLTMPL